MAQRTATKQGSGRPNTRDHASTAAGQQQKVEQEASRAKREARHAAEEATASAQSAAETLKDEASAVAGQVQSAAADAAQQAKQEGQNFLHRQKEWAAEEVSHFEEAIRRASQTLREEDDHNLADYTERAAAGVGRVKEYLKRQDLGELLSDVEQAARRRPELVFGGLLVAGLATARFLKSSSRTRSTRRGRRIDQANPSGGGRLQYASAHQPATSQSPVIETSRGDAVGTTQYGSTHS